MMDRTSRSQIFNFPITKFRNYSIVYPRTAANATWAAAIVR
jgi:hypothetical protein